MLIILRKEIQSKYNIEISKSFGMGVTIFSFNGNLRSLRYTNKYFNVTTICNIRNHFDKLKIK